MRVRVLGSVELVDDDGQVQRIGSPSQRTVLAALAAHLGRVVPSDVLVDALWGDVPPPSAEASLRTYVSRLRRSLGEALATRGDGYVLQLPALAVDAAEFETLLAAARRAEGADALAAFDAALGLWTGQPFGDQADVDCVRAEGRRLVELHATAVEARIVCLVGTGRADEAVAAAEALVADEPLREGGWAALIGALAAAHRPADALRAYQRARAALAEAGLEPSARLRSAEQAVLAAAPAVAPKAGAGSLPPPVASSFVGRDADRDRVLRLLAPGRVVTVVGPGGVGKTRLALEVARDAADSLASGARLVDLSGLTTGDDVADAIVSSLGLAPDGEAAADALERARPLDLLVVLDNAEHVAGAVAEAVERLLGGDASVRLLVTSRERLGVDGEHTWPLASLGLDGDAPGIRLFLERARAAVPDVELSADDPTVRRVVELLDGLPLAIEMAAAHLGTCSLPELADALEESHDMLASPRRRVADRHRTLASVLDWSEKRLDPRQRDVLNELSTFAGPVPAADIEGVLGAADAAAVTRALAARSLVTVAHDGDRARFGLLHTVRTFAARRLRQGGRADLLAGRHLTWFADAARAADAALRTVDEIGAHRRLDAVFGEVRAAHRWARRHDPALAATLSRHLHLYAQSRLVGEPLRWAEELLDELPADDPYLPVVLASAAARAVQRGDLALGRARAQRAIELAQETPASLPALETLGDVELFDGHLDASESAYAELAERAAAGHDLYYLAVARSGVALARCYGGHPARDAFTDLRPLPLGPSARGWLSYTDGELLLDDDPSTSLAHFDRAIALAASSGNRYLEGVARVSSCSLQARAGDVGEARQTFAATIHHWRQLAATTHQITTLRNLAVLLRRTDQPDVAASLLGFLDGQPVPTYGAEAARLHDVEAWARQRLGSDRFATRFAEGRSRSLAATEDAMLAALGPPLPAARNRRRPPTLVPGERLGPS